MSYQPRENIDKGFGGKSSDGTLVFAWNKTDVSQFDASGASPQFAVTGNGSLSVVAVSERGNVLRYSTGGGTTVTEIFLVTAPVVFPDTRRDLLIEMEISSGFGNSYIGPAILCDDSDPNFHGYHFAIGNAEWSACINNDVVERASGTGTGIGNNAGFGRWAVRGDKPASAPPRVRFAGTLHGATDSSTSLLGRTRSSGSDAAARGNMNDAGSNSVLGSTWDDLALDRIGIGVFSSGGNPPPTTADILDFRVYLVDP